MHQVVYRVIFGELGLAIVRERRYVAFFIMFGVAVLGSPLCAVLAEGEGGVRGKKKAAFTRMLLYQFS
jgi:hypothetical protein